MGRSKFQDAASQDVPSPMSLAWRVIRCCYPVPILAIGWPYVVWCACAYLATGMIDPPNYGGVDDEILLCFLLVIGALIGIQISADIYHRQQSKRRHRISWPFVFFSAGCGALSIVSDTAYFTQTYPHSIQSVHENILVFFLVQIPIFAWFLVNLIRTIGVLRESISRRGALRRG